MAHRPKKDPRPGDRNRIRGRASPDRTHGHTAEQTSTARGQGRGPGPNRPGQDPRQNDQANVHGPGAGGEIRGRAGPDRIHGHTANGPGRIQGHTAKQRSTARVPGRSPGPSRPGRDPWPHGQQGIHALRANEGSTACRPRSMAHEPARIHGRRAQKGSTAYGPRRGPRPRGQQRVHGLCDNEGSTP